MNYFPIILKTGTSRLKVGHPTPLLQELKSDTKNKSAQTTANAFKGFFFMLLILD